MEMTLFKILAIDDNQDNLISLKALIKESFPQAEIATAQNGLSGIKIAKTFEPDMIFLDVVMPEMDGFEVCKILKSDKQTGEIPVIFITAIKGDKENRIKALEIGADAFLAKPVDVSELTAQIRAMMKIRTAFLERNENRDKLEKLVKARTKELHDTHIATLNMLEDLHWENEKRKKSEAALRASEDRFSKLFYQAPLGYQSLDVDGNLLEVNQKWLDTLGYKREEVIGKWFGDFQTPASREGFKERFQNFKAQGQIKTEVEMLHRNGEILHIAFDGKIASNLDGSFLQTHCILQNITERKRSEQRINLLADMVDNAPNSITVHDAEGNFLYANKKTLEMHGFSMEEFERLNLHELDVPESEILINQRIEKIEKFGETSFEAEHFKKDGSRLPLEVFVKKVEWFGKKAILSIATDITERKQRENDVLELKNRYKSLFDNSLVGIGLATPDGKVIESNEAFASMLGYSQEELKTQSVRNYYLNPEDRKTVIDTLKQSKSLKDFETKLKRKDGSAIDVISNISLVTINGVPLFQTSCQDVSERKVSQDKLIKEQKRLEYILDATHTHFNILDGDYNIHQVDTGWQNIYGEPKDKKCYQYFMNKNTPCADCGVKKALSTKKTVIYEEFLPKENRFIEVHTIPFQDENGKWLVAEFNIDITERKKAEQELEIQYRLLKIAGETAKFGGWDVDLKTNISHWSDVVAAIHEMPAGFAPKLEDGIHFYAPEWRDKITEVFTACAEQGIPYDEEMEIITSQGKRKWVRTVGKAIRDEDDKIYKVHGAFQDISEKKQTELQIVESEKKYSNLYREMLDGFALHEMIFDEKGKPVDYRYLEVNPAFERLTGLKRDTILGKTVLEILPETEFYWIENYSKVVTSQKPIFFENYSKELNKFYQVKAFHTSKNQFATIFSDITELKRNQEKIENLNSLLLAVRNINQIIVQENDLQKIMEKSCESLLETRNYLNIEIALYDDEKKVIKPVAHSGAQKFKDWSITINGDGNAPHCIKETVKLQKPFVIRESDSICGDCQNYKEDSVHQTILVPMKLQEKLVGILTVRMLPKEHFSKEEIELLVEVAGDLAFARQKHISDNLLNYTLLRYQELFENCRDGFVVCSMNRKIIDANEALCKMLGYSLKELKDLDSNLAIVPERWHEKEREIWKRELLERGFSDVYEKEYIRKDGDIFPIEIQTFVVYDKEGNAEYIWGIVRDISERKLAEEKLKEVNRVFKHSIDMLCIAGFDGFFKVLNPAWEKTLGWSSEELLSKPWIEFTHPEDVEETNKVKSIKLENGEEVYQFENRYICKDGAIKWLAWNSFPYPEEGLMFGVARDVTNQKLLEQQAKKRENFLSKVFEILPIGLWFADENGKLLKGNPAGIEIWGAEPKVPIEEYGVFSARRLPSGEEIRPYDWALAHTIKEKVTVSDELLEIDAFDGKKKIILNYTAPVLDDEGNLLGAIVVNNDITEKQNIFDSLTESEARKRSYFEKAPYGIFITDNKGNYLEVNPQACEITGYSKEELEKMSIPDLIPKEELAHGIKHFETVLQEGYSYGETTFKTKSGEIRWWSVAATKISDDLLLGFCEDVTERKQLEFDLKESEERFKALHNASFGGIAIHDKGIILECNKGMSEMTGYSYDELIGMDGLKLIAEESREKVMKNILAGYEKPYEAIGQRKNGETYPLQLEARNVHYKGKQVRTVEFRDITEAKQAEAALKQSELKFRHLFETMSQGVVYQNKTGEIIFANPAAEKILGLSFEQMKGRTSLYPRWKAVDKDKNELPGDKHPAMIALNTGEKIENYLQGIFHPQKNDYVWIVVNSTPIFKNGEKEPSTVYSLFLDITERIHAEQEIKQLLKEKETLLQEVHHRVKNNMGVVQSLLSLQAKAIDNENCKSVLQEAAGRLQSMITLYNKLYRSEIGRDLSLEAFLRPLLDDIVKVFAKVVDVKTELQIENIVLSPKTLVPLGIILNECITNSIKYAFKEEGNGVIFVTATQKDDTVLLTYSDGKEMVSPELFVKSDTFGLKLIYLLVKQIRGNIRLEKDGFAKYVIEFPKK
jgi:PAS domain S-box-containing protein